MKIQYKKIKRLNINFCEIKNSMNYKEELSKFLNKDLNKLSIEECYDILGIDYNTSIQEIKKKYRNLASQYHPDKLPIEEKTRFDELKNKVDELEAKKEELELELYELYEKLCKLYKKGHDNYKFNEIKKAYEILTKYDHKNDITPTDKDSEYIFECDNVDAFNSLYKDGKKLPENAYYRSLTCKAKTHKIFDCLIKQNIKPDLNCWEYIFQKMILRFSTKFIVKLAIIQIMLTVLHLNMKHIPYL